MLYYKLMKIGNCLIGLIPIMIKKKFKGRIVVISWQGIKPHTGYRFKNKVYHYKLKRRIKFLPKFFRYIAYKGKYEVVNLGSIPDDVYIMPSKE